MSPPVFSELTAQVEVLLRLGFTGLETDELEDEQIDAAQRKQAIESAAELYTEAHRRAIYLLETYTAKTLPEVPVLHMVLSNIASTCEERAMQLREEMQQPSQHKVRAPGGGTRPDRRPAPPAEDPDSESGRRQSDLERLVQRLQGSGLKITLETLEGLSHAAVDVIDAGVTRPTGSLEDVAGCESVKQALRESLLLPMRHPHLFRGLRKAPNCFLLYGPPGTGKTLLAEKCCAEAGLPLISVSPSGLLSKYLGESEKAIKGTFEAAKRLQPCVIFLDEIDSLAPRRGKTGEEPAARRILTELLLQMSALKGEDHVVIVAATNRLEDLDDAIVRRFDRSVPVGLPDTRSRTQFLQIALSRPELTHCLAEGEIQDLASRTEQYSGSDLLRLVKEAAMQSVRDLMQTMHAGSSMQGGDNDVTMYSSQCQSQLEGGSDTSPAQTSPLQLRPINMHDFQHALALVRPSAETQFHGQLQEFL